MGRSVRIGVGEPWGFESPDGAGVLKGRITEVHRGEEDDLGEQHLVIEVTPFEAEDGSTVSRLVAKRRYRDRSGIIEQVTSGEVAPATLDYSAQVDTQRMPEGTSPFLVGRVELTMSRT